MHVWISCSVQTQMLIFVEWIQASAHAVQQQVALDNLFSLDAPMLCDSEPGPHTWVES